MDRDDWALKMINKANNSPVDNFEGLSPVEMESLLYNPFTIHSPVQLKTEINPKLLSKVPFLLLVEAYLKYILENKEIKLTSIGNLPRAVLHHLYGLGYIKEDSIETELMKLSKEDDSISIQNVKNICDISGLTTKRKGKLTVSKKGKDLLKNRSELFKTIFINYCTRLNIGYHDRLGESKIGHVGNSFILGLLIKYGSEEHESKFYADKYLKAFPTLINGIKEHDYRTKDKSFSVTVRVRVFERFLNWFSIIDTRQEGNNYVNDLFIKKTVLLDEVFEAPKFMKK
jgi:hypothetical protein